MSSNRAGRIVRCPKCKSAIRIPNVLVEDMQTGEPLAVQARAAVRKSDTTQDPFGSDQESPLASPIELEIPASENSIFQAGIDGSLADARQHVDPPMANSSATERPLDQSDEQSARQPNLPVPELVKPTLRRRPLVAKQFETLSQESEATTESGLSRELASDASLDRVSQGNRQTVEPEAVDSDESEPRADVDHEDSVDESLLVEEESWIDKTILDTRQLDDLVDDEVDPVEEATEPIAESLEPAGAVHSQTEEVSEGAAMPGNFENSRPTIVPVKHLEVPSPIESVESEIAPFELQQAAENDRETKPHKDFVGSDFPIKDTAASELNDVSFLKPISIGTPSFVEAIPVISLTDPVESSEIEAKETNWEERLESANADRKLLARFFALCLCFVAIVNMTPALYQWYQWTQLAETMALPRWIYIQVFVGAIHLVYAVFLFQINDWSAMRAVSVAMLFVAFIFGFISTGLLVGGGEGNLTGFLGIPYMLNRQACIWCVAMLCLATLMSYWGGKESTNWQRTDDLLKNILNRSTA